MQKTAISIINWLISPYFNFIDNKKTADILDSSQSESLILQIVKSELFYLLFIILWGINNGN